jgi:hypothetical protein
MPVTSNSGHGQPHVHSNSTQLSTSCWPTSHKVAPPVKQHDTTQQVCLVARCTKYPMHTLASTQSMQAQRLPCLTLFTAVLQQLLLRACIKSAVSYSPSLKTIHTTTHRSGALALHAAAAIRAPPPPPPPPQRHQRRAARLLQHPVGSQLLRRMCCCKLARKVAARAPVAGWGAAGAACSAAAWQGQRCGTTSTRPQEPAAGNPSQCSSAQHVDTHSACSS